MEFLELRLEGYKKEKEHLGKLAKIDGPSDITGIDYTASPIQSSSQMGYLEYLERAKKVDNHIYLHKNRLEEIKEQKEKIDKLLGQLEDRHYQVCYKRYVEGKTQEKIAEETGYSTRQIRKILKKYNISSC